MRDKSDGKWIPVRLFLLFEWLSDGLMGKKKGERNVWKDFFEVLFGKFEWCERMD